MSDHKMLCNATFIMLEVVDTFIMLEVVDAFIMLEVVDAPHFIVQLWHFVTLTAILNCSEKCGFN